MNRVFISNWLRVDGVLQHGLSEVIAAVPDQSGLLPADRFRARQLLPDSDPGGLPTQPATLLIISGDNSIESWADLPGVAMLPPFDLSQTIADLPTDTVNEVIEVLAQFGVPYPAVAGSVTAGELLDKIMAFFQADPPTMAQMFAGQFAAFA